MGYLNRDRAEKTILNIDELTELFNEHKGIVEPKKKIEATSNCVEETVIDDKRYYRIEIPGCNYNDFVTSGKYRYYQKVLSYKDKIITFRIRMLVDYSVLPKLKAINHMGEITVHGDTNGISVTAIYPLCGPSFGIYRGGRYGKGIVCEIVVFDLNSDQKFKLWKQELVHLFNKYDGNVRPRKKKSETKPDEKKAKEEVMALDPQYRKPKKRKIPGYLQSSAAHPYAGGRFTPK